jgi:hypothetical protein
MLRRLALTCCMCLGCSGPNPAFDEGQVGDSVDGTLGDTTDVTTDDSAGTESETGTSGGVTDTPIEPACDFKPSPGMALTLGRPMNLGGSCVNGGFNFLARVVIADADKATLQSCGPECTLCNGEIPLAAAPLDISAYLPEPMGPCVTVQAAAPLGEVAGMCTWGALSIRDPASNAALLIATSHSAEPTPHGVELLADVIPEPLLAGNCNCDDVGQGNDCCYQNNPPEFWYYPFEAGDVDPGEELPVMLANSNSAEHVFKLFQAELIHTCENDERQLSWAVVATEP